MTDPIKAQSVVATAAPSSVVSPGTPTSPTAAERQVAASSGTRSPGTGAEAVAPPNAAVIAQATQNITDFVQSISRSLQISVDGDLGTTVIRVVDTETDELVRQIPSEEILQVARFIEAQTAVDSATRSAVLGLLVDQEG